MKPGGQLLISDYGCDNYDKQTEDFKSYIAERGYTLYTVDDYAQVTFHCNNIDKLIKVCIEDIDLFIVTLTISN